MATAGGRSSRPGLGDWSGTGSRPYACPGCHGELTGGASGSSAFSSVFPAIPAEVKPVLPHLADGGPGVMMSFNLRWKGFLTCETCGASYPVEDGVPDFVTPGVAEYDDFLVAWFEKYNLEAQPTFLDNLGNPDFERDLLEALGLEAVASEGEAVVSVGETSAAGPGVAEGPELILDLCCGRGGLGKWLAARGHEVYFCDISSEALRHLKDSPDSWFELRPGPLPVARASVLGLPFATGSLDRVMVGYTYHNWSDRHYRLRALAELRRVLRPGGRIDLLWVPNWWPRLLAPGNWISPRRFEVHVLRSVMGYVPLAPFEVEAEVGTFFEVIGSREAPGSSSGGLLAWLTGRESRFWSLAADSFCVSGRVTKLEP